MITVTAPEIASPARRSLSNEWAFSFCVTIFPVAQLPAGQTSGKGLWFVDQRLYLLVGEEFGHGSLRLRAKL